MSSLISFRVYSVALLVTYLSLSLLGQVPVNHMTAGLPWTVVDSSELPIQAKDSITLNAILDDWQNTYELRHLFRVYFHPELTQIVDDKIYAEIPREPGVSEVVHWERGEIDSTELDFEGTFDILRYRGYGSADTNVLPYSEFELTYVINRDSTSRSYPEDFYSTVKFGPGFYLLFGGPKGRGANRYGYFFQWVDSIYHPQVSNIREQLSPIQVKAFPNPCTDNLTIRIPELWSLKPSMLTILQGTTGQVVFQSQLPIGEEQIALNADVIGGLIPSTYAAFIRREDGEGGVAFVNFVKQ